MSLHRRANCLSDDQPDSRAVVLIAVAAPVNMHDDVELRRTQAAFDGRVELG